MFVLLKVRVSLNCAVYFSTSVFLSDRFKLLLDAEALEKFVEKLEKVVDRLEKVAKKLEKAVD